MTSSNFTCPDELNHYPHVKNISATKCVCQNGYVNNDEIKQWDDCHIPEWSVIFMYGVVCCLFLVLFCRTFSVAARGIPQTPYRDCIKLLHEFLLLFTSFGLIRMLVALSGYRYHQGFLLPRVLTAGTIASWISCLVIMARVWWSSYRALSSTKVSYKFLTCVMWFCILIAWFFSLSAMLIPVTNPDLEERFNFSIYISYILVVMVLGLSLLAIILRFFVWWPTMILTMGRNAFSFQDLRNVRSRLETVGFFLALGLTLVAVVILLENAWLTRHKYVEISVICIVVTLIGIQESYFFDPDNGVLSTIFTTYTGSAVLSNRNTYNEVSDPPSSSTSILIPVPNPLSRSDQALSSFSSSYTGASISPAHGFRNPSFQKKHKKKKKNKQRFHYH